MVPASSIEVAEGFVVLRGAEDGLKAGAQQRGLRVLGTLASRCARQAPIPYAKRGETVSSAFAAGLAVLVAVLLFVALDAPAEARPRGRQQTPANNLRAREVPLPVRKPTRASTAAQPAATNADAPRDAAPATLAPAAPPSAPAAQQSTVIAPSAAVSAPTPPTQQPPSEPRPTDTATNTVVAVLPPASAAVLLPERVRTIMQKHCSRCHQSGALDGRLQPEGGIANILSVDELALDPGLVRPGEPDASPIYQQMIARQMPPDVMRHGAAGSAPSADEMQSVRAWIKSLDRAAAPSDCQGRTQMTQGVLDSTMAQWLDRVGTEQARDTRFISLAHIVNSCASDASLAAYREGVIKTLNSLTWSTSPALVETIGESLAIMAVRLSSLGWTREQWDFAAKPNSTDVRLATTEDVRKRTGTEVPIVAGDWLAERVMDPAFYSRLLRLPDTLDGLAKKLGIDLDDQREDRVARRGVLTASKVTGGPRVIERYPTAHGALWLAHDYQSDADAASVFDNPLLPWADNSEGASKPVALTHLGTRALFSLPTGFAGFMAFDAGGKAKASIAAPVATVQAAREPTAGSGETGKAAEGGVQANGKIEVGQQGANGASRADAGNGSASSASNGGSATGTAKVNHGDAVSAAASVREMRSGLSCGACHAQGAEAFEDRLAEHLESQSYRGNSIARDIARQFVMGKSELAATINDDRFGIRRALTLAGGDGDGRAHGQELIMALAGRYNRDLDLAAAAAEMLITPDELADRLAQLERAEPETNALAMRLLYGRLSRAELGMLRPALERDSTGSATVATLGTAAAAANVGTGVVQPQLSGNALQLWPDKPAYFNDDRITLKVRSGRACYLTLVNIDNEGRATVLFPNEFDRDNLIKAGEVIRLPGNDASYRFVMKRPGSESFVAICEEGEPVPAGIRPDFTHHNFTPLGSWERFLDASVKAAREPRVPLNNGDDIDRRKDRAPAKLRPAPATAPAQSRAAITVRIAH